MILMNPFQFRIFYELSESPQNSYVHGEQHGLILLTELHVKDDCDSQQINPFSLRIVVNALIAFVFYKKINLFLKLLIRSDICRGERGPA